MVTSTERQTFKFPKGTPEALQTEALAALPLLNQFVTGASQSILQLEESYNFLTLKANLGESQFKRLLKAHAPLAAKDILQKLSVAELVQRVPQFGCRILALGAEACDTLRKASDDLVARILAETSQCAATTVSVLKTLVTRERKGFAPIPTDEEKRAYAKGTLVEITKSGQLQGWVAEVISEPNNFGQLQVRLLKNCRKRTLFLHEVKLHAIVQTPDSGNAMTPTDWEAIAASYVFPTNNDKYVALTDNDLQNIKAIALEIARADADPEATEIVIRWRHALVSIERYGLVAAHTNINPPSRSAPEPNSITPLIEALAASRQMKATLTEEFDACVTEETRDLLRQKLRYVEREIERILDQLCAGQNSASPMGWAVFDNSSALEEKDREIAKMRSELESNKNALATLTQENQSLAQQVADLFVRLNEQELLKEVSQPTVQPLEASQGVVATQLLEESQKRIIQLEKLVQEYSTREIEFKKGMVGGKDILELEEFLKANFDKKLVREISIWEALREAPLAAADTIRLLAEKLKYEMDAHKELDFEEMANSSPPSGFKKGNKQLSLF